ncbi:MAG: hypothetical protein U5K54_22655 [Cytophagales bacterium]|nr:hypothetical protein [Cytophagales bacterium]
MALQIWAQSPSLQWAKGIGGTSTSYVGAMGVDALGNVYTTGQFNGVTDFDPGASV